MGLFDLFKKTAKTEDVRKLFEEAFKEYELAGYPLSKTSTNFYVSPYNTLKKDVCSFSMKVENTFSIDYQYIYNRKEKKFFANVILFKLKIDGRVEQEALKKTFPSFNIYFLPSAVNVKVFSMPCKTIDDVKKGIVQSRKIWNESRFFELIKSEFSPCTK